MKMAHAGWCGVVLASTVGLSFSLAGCGSGLKENPPSIGITNPDPKDPLYGVTLENEAQNLDRIKAGNGIKSVQKR